MRRNAKKLRKSILKKQTWVGKLLYYLGINRIKILDCYVYDKERNVYSVKYKEYLNPVNPLVYIFYLLLFFCKIVGSIFDVIKDIPNDFQQDEWTEHIVIKEGEEIE